MRVLIVGMGGIMGALARYGIYLLLNDKGLIPWGTLTVNLLGCFLLAVFLTVVLHRYSGSSYFVLAVATGFIGSLTTFSTLSVEGIMLLKSSYEIMVIYLNITIIGGYLLTWAGSYSGHFILGTGWGKKWTRAAAEVNND